MNPDAPPRIETDVWHFATTVDPHRIERLCAVSCFDEIARAIERDITRPGGIQYNRKPGKTERTRGYWRPSYLLTVESATGVGFLTALAAIGHNTQNLFKEAKKPIANFCLDCTIC